MDNSILTSIKKLLGIAEEFTQFDQDIIIHINAVFSILNQMGVGTEKAFFISDETSIWSDFLDDREDLEMIKSYMYMKVRMMWDPPTSSTLAESMKNMISEYEWRMYSLDNFKKEDTDGI